MKSIDRRTLLRGAAGVSLALPLLEIMSSRAARADGASRPKRVLFVVQDNGTVMDNWHPSGTETAFALSSMLKPLEPFQSELLLLDGVTNQVVQDISGGPGRGHDAIGMLLTARKLQNGSFSDGNGDPHWTGAGVSIDQEVANRIGSVTRYKSLNVFCGTHPLDDNIAKSIQAVVSWTGPNQANVAQRDPQKVFDSLVGNLSPSASDASNEVLVARRKSVLDATAAAIAELASKLGANDKHRLNAHLAAIQEIEQSLASTTMACTPATRPQVGIVTGKWDRYVDVIGAHTNNIAMAFACDLTRVAVMQWGSGTSNQQFPFLGFTDEHHTLSHLQTPDAYAKLTKIENWYAARLADVLTALSRTKEGSGSLLDSTAVVWMNNLSNGATHSESKMGWVVAGSLGGHFRTGRWVKLAGQGANHGNLFVSLLQGLGFDINTFGDPQYCSGPMPGLV